MPYTLSLSLVESIVANRTAGGLKVSGLTPTPTTDSSPRAYLNDAIATAIRRSGGAVADPVAVTSGDLATVPAGREDLLLDLAELRTLETILGNWTQPDQSAGQERQDLGKLRDSIAARVKDLRAQVLETIKVIVIEEPGTIPGTTPSATGTLTSGVVVLGFADDGRRRDWPDIYD